MNRLPEVRVWRQWLEQLVADPRRLPGYCVLKYAADNEVARAHLPWTGTGEDRCLEVVVRRTVEKGLRAAGGWFRASRARRNFRRAVELLRAGIGTAEPLAVIERRRPSSEAFLVTEFLTGAVDLDCIVLRLLSPLAARRRRRIQNQLIEAVAELLGNLDRRGLHHRDLKASNILLRQWEGEESRPRAAIVDLDGLSKRRWWSAGQRWQPLVRLAASLLDSPNVSRSDYLRFLRRYLMLTSHGTEDWKSRFRALAEQAADYAARSGRRKAGKLDGYAAP